MPIEPNIALGVKPLEVPNPLNQFAQAAQIQHYQNQNRLADMQAAEYERARTEEEGTRNFLRGKDLFSPEVQTGLLQYGKTGREFASNLATQRKLGVETQSAEFKLAEDKLKHGLESVSSAPTPQAYVAKIKEGVARGYFSPADAEARIAQVPQNPEEYKKFRIDSLLHLVDNKDKLAAVLPNVKQQEAGGQIVNIQNNPMMPGYGLPVAGQSIAKTMTPGEEASNKIARDRLNAEMATGVLTPQSLDVAANVYLQTGQLPTGLGKTAAGLRSQVMNRATELSTGKPAADVADTIVGAKLDVASRGKAIKDFGTGLQGRQVSSFNTAIDHLSTMDKLADALNNGDIKAFNAIGNAFARQTGSAAPSNFDTAKNIVGSEVAKAVAGSNMALKDREEIRDQILAASSPEQLKGVTTTLKQLLGGQLKSLNLQYENTTGRKDFDKKLTGEAKNVVQQLRGEAGGGAVTPIYATNGTTRIMSTDGGATWVPAK